MTDLCAVARFLPCMCGLRSDGCESYRRLHIEATETRLALHGASEPNSGDS